MKMIGTVLFVLLLCVGCSPSETLTNGKQEIGMLQVNDKRAVKDSFPYAKEWQEVEFKGTEFLCGHGSLPAFGVSRIGVQCWKRRDDNRGWDQVLNVRTRDVMRGEFIFDANSGLLQFVGKAPDKIKDQPIITFDLNVAGGP